MFKIINYLLATIYILFSTFFNHLKAESLFRSHEATYELKLNNVTRAGQIHSVGGKMHVDVRKICDGWIFNQYTTLDITDRLGNQNRSEFRYSTWESIDHKRFRFLSRSNLDGKEMSNVEGYAFIQEDFGKIIFNVPIKKELEISSKTIFPMNHFFLAMKERSKNNFLYTEIVFTGENEDSLNLVSTFTNYIQNNEKDNKFIKIRSAYFSLVNLYEKPETEIELIVYEDGVVKSVIFDYIDYEIKGVLFKHKYILDLKC